MKRKVFSVGVFGICLVALGTLFLKQNGQSEQREVSVSKPSLLPIEEEGRPDKQERWSQQEANFHQLQLEIKRSLKKESTTTDSEIFPPRLLAKSLTQTTNTVPSWPDFQLENFVNGGLVGKWKRRGPDNQPGCWKLAEVVESSNTVYGVTCAHYAESEFIFKGVGAQDSLATDNYVLINGRFPNQFNSLHAIESGSLNRLVVDIHEGGVFYTDDDGKTWNPSSGLMGTIHSLIMNRQDNNILYAASNNKIFISTDLGETFEEFQSFNNSLTPRLYTPRYDIQPDSNAVYLSRMNQFYKLESGSFVQKGSLSGLSSTKKYSVAGDSRKLYISSNDGFWSSTNEGSSWTKLNPNVIVQNNTDDRIRGSHFFGVNPEDPDNVLTGYMNPSVSWDGLQTSYTPKVWGLHQVQLEPEDYRHRVKIHADHQSTQFFYDAKGKLFSLHSTDGGLYISYNFFSDTTFTLNGQYANNIFYNLTLHGSQSAEVYPSAIVTGAKHPDHIQLGTQDQGDQRPRNLGNEILLFNQAPHGDGKHIVSGDGLTGWSYHYSAKWVSEPFSLYSGDTFNGRKNQGTNQLNLTQAGYFHNAYVDKSAPAQRMWILSKNLVRVEYNSSLSSKSTALQSSGYVGAIAQSKQNPSLLFAIQNGFVNKTTNSGDSWNTSADVFTGITKSKTWDRCGGWVSPVDDKLVLFACPSGTAVVSVLSKDGGVSFSDVSGEFPNSDVGGMVGSPDGKYVYASTEYGPYVFDVASETWHDLSGDHAPWFNGRTVEYIQDTLDSDSIEHLDIVRFSTWGLGVWDFEVQPEGTVLPSSSQMSSFFVGSSSSESEAPSSSFVSSSSESETVVLQGLLLMNVHPDKLQYQIYSSIGTLEKSGRIEKGNTLDLSTLGLKNGVYFIQTFGEGHKKVQKIQVK